MPLLLSLLRQSPTKSCMCGVQADAERRLRMLAEDQSALTMGAVELEHLRRQVRTLGTRLFECGGCLEPDQRKLLRVWLLLKVDCYTAPCPAVASCPMDVAGGGKFRP